MDTFNDGGARAHSHHNAEPGAEGHQDLQEEKHVMNDKPEHGNPMDEDRRELLEEVEEGKDMEEAADLREAHRVCGDADVAKKGAGDFEEEQDLEEKEKDWDADVGDEDIEEFEEDDRQAMFNGEGTEQRTSATAQVDANAGAEADLDGETADVNEKDEGEEASEQGQEQLEVVQKTGILLPLARVKRIVKVDPDIKQVSSEALKTIALATELFLGSLAVSTAHVTQAGKRSTVKLEDLLQAVKSRRRYKECLGTDLEALRPVDTNQAARQEARQVKMKEKARELAPGVKPITSFFKK